MEPRCQKEEADAGAVRRDPAPDRRRRVGAGRRPRGEHHRSDTPRLEAATRSDGDRRADGVKGPERRECLLEPKSRS